jgi:hypothetical protein
VSGTLCEQLAPHVDKIAGSADLKSVRYVSGPVAGQAKANIRLCARRFSIAVGAARPDRPRLRIAKNFGSQVAHSCYDLRTTSACPYKRLDVFDTRVNAKIVQYRLQVVDNCGVDDQVNRPLQIANLPLVERHIHGTKQRGEPVGRIWLGQQIVGEGEPDLLLGGRGGSATARRPAAATAGTGV